MAGPESSELLSFRRTFTLLVLLVVLPSAGLSGFGVVAIVNERAAVEKRLEAAWAGPLARAQATFLAALQAARVRELEPRLVLEADGVVLGGPGFMVQGEEVDAEHPHVASAVKALGPELAALPERPLVFSVTSPQGTVMLAALRHGDRVMGAQVTLEALGRLLAAAGAAAMPPGEEARFVLVPAQREAPPEGVVARLVSNVSEASEAALGPRELASVTLPSPMSDFRLVVQATGEDPVAQASLRNRVLYGVLLGLFYVTLAVGVVFTGRTLYREAKLSRLRTDFVSLVSHELRTPLTSIRMFIETLALGRVPDPAEVRSVLELLSKETARLSGMIESVLEWSRLESGRKQYRRERLAPAALVETALGAFRAQHLGEAVPLEVTVAPDLPALDVDTEALSGALLNLVQNAWKYSPAEKHLALRALRDGDFVVFEVEDRGVGIAPKDLKRVFDRFYRVDSLLTRSTEGSGLGLSIAQRLVQAHEGWISVDSEPGRGSTFRIHLPVAE